MNGIVQRQKRIKKEMGQGQYNWQTVNPGPSFAKFVVLLWLPFAPRLLMISGSLFAVRCTNLLQA